MKIYRITFIVTFLAINLNIVSAQNKITEKGNKKFEVFAYNDAIDIYLKAIRKGEESPELYANLADSYYENSNMNNAAIWYGELMKQDLNQIKGEYYFKYAQALKAIGDYSKSDEWLQKLYELNNDDTRAADLKYEPNYVERIELQSNRFNIDTVSINSEFSDFAAAYGDRGVIFASSRENGVAVKRTHTWTGLPFLELFTALVAENGDLIVAQRLKNDFNNKYNESTTAITKDGKTMYFTRNSYSNGYQKDENGIIRLKLYKATREGDTWVNAEELPFNNKEYSVAHPALSPDNTKLYFASDMPGTKGLSDLYVVDINADGSYSSPRNLGDRINTEGRDTFPFISESGHLYFSSDGHLGLGNLDVFVCLDPSNPTDDNIYNLGKPVNSKKDDFAFIIDDNSKLGYFTSNRDGGLGSDDIYKVKQLKAIVEECTVIVDGTVVNKLDGNLITNASVTIYDNDFNVLHNLESDDDGAFSFELDCKEANTYNALGEKEKFKEDQQSFTVDGDNKLQLRLALEPKPAEVGTDLFKLLNLNPIYFDYDKSFIRPDAEIELAKIIAYMKEYPSVKIDVRSHTDSRGSDSYNLKLSQRRNTSTINYIRTKGEIAKDRITGKGYGETQLTNQCKNGVKCTDEEHEQNRRSEFIVVAN
ncbi:MAG: OmpA family protein [Winogradskyella sp.]|nr:PD40 domain-containing protein [Winogradskyella sp.]NNF86802.1 OmpA family protein [Winogradskyella sp.]NNK39321.1 OmpA family protein [Winogradskyella sp.]